MSILANIDFETGSFPTGVSAVVGGASTAAVTTPGLVGGSNDKGHVVKAASQNAAILADFSAVAGSSVGLVRSVGGYFKISASSGDFQLLRMYANAGATLLARVARVGGVWSVVYVTDAGNQTLTFNSTATVDDGLGHKFHLAIKCSATASDSWMMFYIDDVLLAAGHFDGNAISFGTGVDRCYFGDFVASTGTSTIDWDGLYIGDALTPETPSEGGLSGYSGPVAANTRTLTLTTTAGSPAWSTDDADVATVSGGVVTLQQSSGGVVVVRDGTGSTKAVEFLARTLDWHFHQYTLVGSTITVNLTLFSVSDGYLSYADIWPSIVGVNCYVTAISGTLPNLTVTLGTNGSAPYTVYLNGVLTTLDPAGAPMSLTSQIRYVESLDTSSTTGAGKTALAFSDITAKYLTQGGTLTSLTTETITTLGTYQAPTSAAHIRIKELANADPTKGIYEIHFHNTQIVSSGKRIWLFLSATGAKFQPLEIDLIPYLDADAQSATDFKDLVDTGYDPSLHRITSDMNGILGTTLTEGTAGRIEAGFKAFFDVATPVLTVASVNQTGDSFARLGAPVGASISADVAGVTAATAAQVTTDHGSGSYVRNTEPDNTTIGLIAGYTDTIESRLPASLVGGKMDATLSDKTGFKLASDGLDTVAITAPAGVAANFREMLVQVWRRFFKKADHDSNVGSIKTYADNGTSVLTTQTATSVGGVETQGAAT